MRYWFWLLVMSLLCVQANSQLLYHYDNDYKVNILNVNEVKFNPLTDHNKGLKSGSYWIKIDSVPEDSEVLVLKTMHLSNCEIFDSAGRSISPLLNVRYPAYIFKEHIAHLPLYANVILEQEANVPVQFHSISSLNRLEKSNIFVLGLFYGIMVFVILVNFILYVFSGIKDFLAYTALLIVIMLAIAFRDNLPYFFNLEAKWLINLELLIHVAIGTMGMLFAYYYVNLKNRFKINQVVIASLTLISALLFISYLFTKQFIFYALTDLCVLLTLTVIWITAISASKRNVLFYAVAIVYAINIILALDFFVLHNFGIEFLNITPFIFKLGIVLDMFLVSISIFYSWQSLQRNNKYIIDELVKRDKQLELLSQYKMINDINDEYLESLIDQYDLSNKEIKVLQALSKGMNPEKISEELHLPVNTVKQIAKKLNDKLNLSDGFNLSEQII